MKLERIICVVAAAGLATGASAQLIGVDFENDDNGVNSPNNWNTLTGSTPTNIPDLIDETGASTGISFALNDGSPFSTAPDADSLPQHSQSLAGLDDYYFATGVGTAQFRGLTPGQDYFVWVFGLRGFNMNNRVEVLGGGAPLMFDQVSDTPGRLWVNGEEGDDSRTLQSYALVQSADAGGLMDFNFDIVPGGSAGWTISGVAIEVVPAPGSLALLALGGLAATRRRR